MLPKISFLARLTRDVETKFTDAGMCIAKVGLACSEKYGEKESVLFITGTAFKKTGEMIANIRKGQRVFVSGKIQTEQWNDKNSGEKRTATSMIIESFEFIEPKQDNQGQQPQHQQQQNGGFQSPQGSNGQQQQNNQQGFQQNDNGFQNQQNNAGGNSGFQGPPDQDIPF